MRPATNNKPAKICSTDDFYQVFSFLNRNDLDHLLLSSSRFNFLVRNLFPLAPYRLFDRVRINFYHGLHTIAFRCQVNRCSRNRSLRFDNFDNILPYLASKSNKVLERVVLCLSTDCAAEKVKDQIKGITHLWKNATLELDLGGNEELGWNIVANPEIFRCDNLILHDNLPLQILHSGKCALEKPPMLEIERTFPTTPQNVQDLVKLLHAPTGKCSNNNEEGWTVKIHPSFPVDQEWENTTIHALIEELKKHFLENRETHFYKVLLDFPVKKRQEQMVFELEKSATSEQLSLYLDTRSDLYILEVKSTHCRG